MTQSPPKWIKAFKETSFSRLSQINNRGEVVGFDVSDNGKFEKELGSWLDFEILISDLPKKEEKAVRLKSEGLSRKEIAKEMGIKPNAAKQLIYRAYGKIKKRNVRIRKNWEKFSD